MARITEKFQNNRLREHGINIETTYKSEAGILIKNINNSINDNINKGIILEKKYIRNGKIICNIFNFDPRIEYTFIKSIEEEKEISCPNCGNTEVAKNFISGCPYCGTNYNIDYNNKDLGTKYHYDRAINSNNYIKITLLVDIFICLIFMFFYIHNTGRTFNIYDISKIIIFGLVLAIVLFYIFYMIDTIIVILPIKIYKDRLNANQISFWERMRSKGIDKKTFFNNFNYELQQFFYNDKNENNIIDYDIVDYIKLNEITDENDNFYIEVVVRIRVISYQDNKINSKIKKRTFILKKNNTKLKKLHNGINIINCHNCGAPIDVTKKECDYCKTKNNYLQEWYLINNY